MKRLSKTPLAVRVNASTDDLKRTTNLPNVNLFTIGVWAKIVQDRAGSFRYLISYDDNPGYCSLGWDTGNNFEVAGNVGGADFAVDPPLNEWFYGALQHNGSTTRGVWISRGGQVHSVSTSMTVGDTIDQIFFGDDAWNEYVHARFSEGAIWDRYLSLDEIQRAAFNGPRSVADKLIGYYPFDGDLRDEITGTYASGTITYEPGLKHDYTRQIIVPLAKYDPAPTAEEGAGAITASGDANLANPTASASVAQILQPQGAATLAQATASGVAERTGLIEATGDADLDQPTASGEAGLLLDSTGDADLEIVTAAANASQLLRPSGNANIAELLASGTAELFLKANGDADLATIVSAGNASQILLPNGAAIVADLLAAGTANIAGNPVITDVNGDESWQDGDTGLVITGSGFV